MSDKKIFNPLAGFCNFIERTYPQPEEEADWESDPSYQREQAALDRAECMGEENDAQCASDIIDAGNREN